MHPSALLVKLMAKLKIERRRENKAKKEKPERGTSGEVFANFVCIFVERERV